MAKEKGNSVLHDVVKTVGHYLFDGDAAPERIQGWNMVSYATLLGVLSSKNVYVKGICAGLNVAARYYMCKNEAVALREIMDRLTPRNY